MKVCSYTRTNQIMILITILVLVVVNPIGAVIAQNPTCDPDALITRISVSSDGVQANESSSEDIAFSADGRYIAFDSSASNLVPDDTNGVPDVFVYDRYTCQTQRISVASGGVQGNGVSLWPSLSSDGNLVLFISSASNLVDDDTADTFDVFIHDRASSQTTRVLISSMSEAYDFLSASISGDGSAIVFSSYRTNLVNGDTNSADDVFVFDILTKQITRVSVTTAGVQGNGESAQPSISDDGNIIAFVSQATNLVDGDTNNVEDVFVHNRQTGQTTRVSVASNNLQSNGTSYYPDISADGRFITFLSLGDNLIPEGTTSREVFVHDLETHQTSLVSVSSEGIKGDAWSNTASISSNGRFVAFWSPSSNLVSGDHNDYCDSSSPSPGTFNCFDVFVHDRLTRKTVRASVAADGSEGNSCSVMPVISDDGQYVAFASYASNLVANDSNNVADIFVARVQFPNDTQTGPTFTVTTTDDTDDGTCSYGHCSLREAITTANAHPGSDLITFNLPGSGPFTIQPLSPLPDITDPVIIDGTSQPGYAGTPIVELNGSLAGTSATGLKLATNNSTIRGLVINGWGDAGIWIPDEYNGTPCDNNTIQGNYVGTNVAGTSAVPNGAHPTSYAGAGMRVLSDYNLIGGTELGQGNVISGNPAGLNLYGSDNRVLGNLIGTNAQGNAAIANEYGIWSVSSNSQIGDVGSGRNVISGNIWGLLFGGSNNRIWNNAIGTDYTGTQPVPNTGGGFSVAGSPAPPTLHNQIGGTVEQGNIIAYNAGIGLGILDLGNNTWGNTITGNSIFANNNPTNPAGGLGIDLTPSDSVTPNDAGDTDIGPNNLQNFPVLTNAAVQAGNLVVSGTLDTVPAATAYRLDFYANDQCDVSGYGEGQTPLGSANITVSSSGDTPFNLTLPVTVAAGKFITATTTAPDGSTSEFSACVPVVQRILKPVLLQPENNTATANRQPAFTWEALPGVTQYEIQLGRDNPPTQTAAVANNAYVPAAPLLYGTYYWRVRATGSGDEGWSSVWSVTITAPANAAPELNLVTTGTPTLTWGAISWATGYELVVDTDKQFTAPFSYTTTITGNVPAAIVQPTQPLTDGMYYWRVRAVATGRIGAWSSTESFTVDVP